MKVYRILALIVLVAIIGLYVVWKKAPDLVAQKLSKAMQVEVKIADIDLSLRTIKVEKLEIGNPKGSQLPIAFSADSIEVTAPISNYIKDPMIIDEIEVKRIYFSLEFTSPTAKTGNWGTILENLKKTSSPKGTEKKGRTLLIKKLILTDINSDLVYALQAGKIQKLPLIPRLEFTNVSSEEGVAIDQIAQVILDQTLRSVFQKDNLQNMIEGAIESPGGAWEKLSEPIKGLIPK